MWLLPQSIGWPSRIQLLDLLEGTAEMSCSKTWPEQVLGTIAFFEECGGVPISARLCEDPIVVTHVRALTTEYATGGASKRQAPALPMAVVLSLELFVGDEAQPAGLRFLAWVRLVKSWSGLRFHDHLGMKAGSLRLNADGFMFLMSRTKTSGPGKKVSVLPAFVDKEAYISRRQWMKEGYLLMAELGMKEQRDYLVPSLEADYWTVRDSPMSYGEALVTDRLLLGLLKAPTLRRDRWTQGAEYLLPEEMYGYFSEHSERHFLPTLAIAAGFSKEERDYLGRWSPSGADSYVTDAEYIVTKIQKAVALSIRTADPGVLRRRDDLTLVGEFLSKRGLTEDRIAMVLGILKPKLEVLRPDESAEEAEESDGFGDRTAPAFEELARGSREERADREEPAFHPYWMTRSTHKLHKTNSPSCQWNPQRVGEACVWISDVAEARSVASSYCRRCWPVGLSDDQESEDDPLIDA